MKHENKDWIITSTTDKNPEALSEIALISDSESLSLDKIFGKDFAVEISKNPFEKPHFIYSLQKLIIKNLDDILVLFHEAGHGITDSDDLIVKKLLRKIEGDIRNKKSVNFDINELKELLLIRAERMASAYALKKIREIKKEKGVDLLAGQSIKSVLARINLGVESAFEKIKDMREYKEKFNALKASLKR